MDAVQVVVIAAVLTTAYGLGADTFIANLCSDPVLLLSSTSSVLPGSEVTITCSVLGTSIVWDSSQFAAPVTVNEFPDTTGMELDGAFTVQFESFSMSPVFCTTATATITNVQETMDGLNLTCGSTILGSLTTSTVIDVIDPPGVVVFDTEQNCGNVVTNWNALPDDPCPIIEYNVDISGSSVSLAKDQTNYIYPISDSDCGNTIEISVFAVSAAGTGSITTTSLVIVCTPTNVSVVSVSDTNAVVQWTPMDVTGVVGYEVMSMSVEEFPTVYTSALVPANVSMASVLADDYTIPVIFTVTSLLTGNEICYASQTTLPVLQNANTVITSSGVGNVMFPFLHVVMTGSLSVTWSPANGTCVYAISETNGMNVIVNCFGLINNVEYTVEVEITLIVNGALLPVSLSESFIPISTPPSLSSTSVSTPTPTMRSTMPKGLSVPVIVGIAVVALLIVMVILISIIVYVKKKKNSQKYTDSPVALVERRKKDPQTGEDATYEEPAYVQHKTAPTGEVYALPDKQSKPVYAEVNKQTDGMMYADLALSGAGQGGSSRPPNSQEVHYSQVHPSQVHRL